MDSLEPPEGMTLEQQQQLQQLQQLHMQMEQQQQQQQVQQQQQQQQQQMQMQQQTVAEQDAATGVAAFAACGGFTLDLVPTGAAADSRNL